MSIDDAKPVNLRSMAPINTDELTGKTSEQLDALIASAKAEAGGIVGDASSIGDFGGINSSALQSTISQANPYALNGMASQIPNMSSIPIPVEGMSTAMVGIQSQIPSDMSNVLRLSKGMESIAAKSPASEIGQETTKLKYGGKVHDVEKVESGNSDVVSGVTKDTKEAVVNLQNVKWAPNTLSQYRNCTYRFKLVAMGEPYPTKYSEYVSRMRDTNAHVVICETGATKYNITGCTIENMVGPDFRRGNTSATNIKINVSEPMGITLFDAFKNAGEVLKLNNFFKVFYYLEVSFIGYNDDGSVASNVGFDTSAGKSDFSDRQEYGFLLYKVSIKNIDMTMNEAGATYIIDAMPMNEQAMDNLTFRFASPITTAGLTVEGALKKLQESLNKDVIKRYNGIQMFEYEIKCLDSSILQASVVTNPDTVKSEEVQAGRGRTVADFIESILMNSKEISDEYGKWANTPEQQKIFLDIFKVSSEVSYKPDSYVPKSEDYCKKITYYISKYSTGKAFASIAQAEYIKENQKKAMDELTKRNLLVKRYDYIYTGTNTEVLAFDMRFNFNWAALIPVYNGELRGYPSTAHGQVYNETARNRLNAIMSDLKEHSSALEKVLKNSNGMPEELQTEVKNQQTNVQQQIARIERQQQQLSKEQAENPQMASSVDSFVESNYSTNQSVLDTLRKVNNVALSQIAEGRYQKFAEDIQQRKAKDGEITISFHRSPVDDATEHGSGSGGDFDVGKSVMGSVFSQSYGMFAKELQNIVLEIRGDPYWLGNTNMDDTEKLIQSTASTPAHPIYSVGDHCFALVLKCPSGVDEQGRPIFPEGNLFNGIYQVTKVTNTFDHGQFKQTLSALRVPALVTSKVN